MPNTRHTIHDGLTLGMLIEMLEDYDIDTPVRLAMQPAYPMEYTINDAIEVEVDGTPIVYLSEQSQIGYLPEEAQDALNW